MTARCLFYLSRTSAVLMMIAATLPVTTSFQPAVSSSGTMRRTWTNEKGSSALSPSDLILQKGTLSTNILSAATSLSLDTAVAVNDRGGSTSSSPNIGVLLLNLGGPETGDDVEGFLYNLFADPDIIRLPSLLTPLQGLIAWYIAKRRAPKSRAAYASIGGGSPILQYSRQQAQLVAQSIKERYGMQVSWYIGMRYWHPFTEEALEHIRRDKIDALVIVPLYPQFSISTSGSSLRLLQEEFAKSTMASSTNTMVPVSPYRNMVHTVVPSWYDRPGYIQAVSSLLQKELDSFTTEQIAMAKLTTPQEKPLHVLFSAHGVPQSYIAAGDPYQRQIVECVERIAATLLPRYSNTVEVHLSYQSRVGPIEWLRPYTDDVLPALGARGVKNLVVVPISFVSEHIETLEEIDIEYRELAEESGIINWRRCPALNTDPIFIDDMADMVVEALSEPAQTVTEACVANMVSDLVDEQMPGATSLYDSINAAGVQGVGGDDGGFAGGVDNALIYQLGKRTLEQQERTVSRIAMLGVALTLLAELLNGRSLINTLGNIL